MLQISRMSLHETLFFYYFSLLMLNYCLLFNKEKRQATNINERLGELLTKIQLVTNCTYLMRIVKRNQVC